MESAEIYFHHHHIMMHHFLSKNSVKLMYDVHIC